MTPSARLQAVIDLLTSIDEVARPADALVSGYFRSHRYIGSKDRGAISEMTYALIRHQARLNWWIEKLGAEPSSRLRVFTYLRLVDHKETGTIEKLCDGNRYAPAQLTSAEKRFVKSMEGHTLGHPQMPPEIAVECPAWAYPALDKRFGKSFTHEMKAMLDSAPLDLRINPLKVSREDALDELKASEIRALPCKLSPWGIRIKQRMALNTLPLLKEGALEIQDEGSQLVALLVQARPGEKVVDFYAGAGGKTLALAAQMENKGRIVACDVLANRLKRSAERFRRADLHNIETKPLTSENDPWVKRHKESFDRVLVDAPCSGSGTWRRNPDARWKSLGPGLESLVPLQASILASASRLVKKGGRLVYATCSVIADENENQIEAFLKDHPDFTLVPVTEIAKDWLGANYTAPYLALTPAQHDTDGFFAAVMVKKE